VVRQDGPQKRVPPDPDQRGRRMENRLSHTVWPIRIPRHALRLEQRPSNVPRYDEPYLPGHARPRTSHLYGRPPHLRKNNEEHNRIVGEVLQRQRENKLAVSPDKCVWRQTKVEFLGYLIGREGIKMSQGKVEAIQEWKSPSSLTEVQSFLGFAKFY